VAPSPTLRLLLLALFVTSLASSLPAGEVERLTEGIRPLVAAHQGQVAVAVKHLERGLTYLHREHEPQPTASLIKVAIMVAAYDQIAAGKLSLDKRLTITAEDKVPGSGILTRHFQPGVSLTLRDAIRLMIVFSDNTATNLVAREIGLPATSELMQRLGYNETRLHAFVFKPDSSIAPDRSKKFGLGSTTAMEQLRLFEALYRKQLGTPDHNREMIDHLEACDDHGRFTRFLPEGTKVAIKTGSVADVRTASGIIHTPGGPVALVVLTAENKDRRYSPFNAGELLTAEIARVVYETFDTPAMEAPVDKPTGELALGATGDLVEALQRTLNVRVAPSPALTPDGEYGPSTRKAVARFQLANRLKETGIVDAGTWQALGPLAAGPEPVPDPATINAEVLPQEPPDDPSAPPPVTAAAWIVADPQSGQIIGGHNERQRRDFASTTKTMTAYLVLRLAQKSPELLDEPLTFSKRADQTPGSTAGLRHGERVSVRETLYGLMLPSGNDASVALAEHFGGRFDPAPPSPVQPPPIQPAPADPKSTTPPAPVDDSPYGRFIAEMNRTAAALGMTDTQYANPHGLTDKQHLSSARDQFLLARAALELPLFREITSTRRRGATVTGPGGYQRNIVWKNTNKLLDIQGYNGVKTGTTDAAGACLVSHGTRDGRTLIVVVLGSTSPDARYLDSRHLYRWAWLKL
jgi:D-alanyl-D-alanine carboxypeptidase (penicillin-binding protein 5/6)